MINYIGSTRQMEKIGILFTMNSQYNKIHDLPRGIVVIDIGSTNVKATLYDEKLTVLASKTTGSCLRDKLPYLSIDVDPVVAFAFAAIEEFDNLLPVDVVVPCSHGSSLALLDKNNELCLPVMSYNAEPPEDIIIEYRNIEPEFSEVFAPTNPGALTLARQLLWQETNFPRAFASVETILPLAQFLTLKLCGVAASEISALGAQTHLWDPKKGDYSNLAKTRGWAQKFAPIRPAWQSPGEITTAILRGQGQVLTGIHDSNANFYRYHNAGEFALLSTGTWIIAFDSAIDIERLDPLRDQVCNTTIFGDPVACCRFMGGQEFSIIAKNAPPNLANVEAIAGIVKDSIFCLPSFTNSGGPLPHTGGKGNIVGLNGDGNEFLASLAALYTAQMTSVALYALGTKGRVIVDGPFSVNLPYLKVLATCMPQCEIMSAGEGGTGMGAAMLALLSRDQPWNVNPPLQQIEPLTDINFSNYHRQWLDKADTTNI